MTNKNHNKDTTNEPLLPEILSSVRTVVCVGSGGVGKTTLASSLALSLAKSGKRVLVITIDPAKRLADALGVKQMGNNPTLISSELLSQFGVHLRNGATLSAMMLDVMSVWDNLIDRYAKNNEQKNAIFNNPFYRRLRSSLAGTNEYMALEKLYELHQSEAYDVIVLDTPPSIHALDFIDAPQKLVDLLNNQSIKLFTLPYKLGGRTGMRVLGITNSIIMKRLAEMTGTGLLKSLAEFMVAFEGMYEGFKKRAESVSELMRSKKTLFLIIGAPTEGATEEASRLYSAISERSMSFGAFIVNQMHPLADLELDDKKIERLRADFFKCAAGKDLSNDDWEYLLKNAQYSESLYKTDMERISDLKKFEFGKSRIIGVDRYSASIGGIEMLEEISNSLWKACEM